MLGPGQLPQPEHQRVLPYTSAVLHEVQRYITLLPHVPRCTAADIQLGGYLLPKVGPHLLLPFNMGCMGDFLGLIFTWGRWVAGTPLDGVLPSSPAHPGTPLLHRALL